MIDTMLHPDMHHKYIIMRVQTSKQSRPKGSPFAEMQTNTPGVVEIHTNTIEVPDTR